MQDIAITHKFPARISLARLPTPIQPLKRLSGLTPGIELLIKRDDLTGCALSGNKARKLEFLLAEAQRQKSTILLTCGGLQSNHARAMAVAGASLGMKSLLVLRGEQPPLPEGNLLLDLLVGTQIKYISKEEYAQAPRIMAELAQALSEQGEVPYVIPEGGSNPLGALGYAMAMAEINRQLEGNRIDYLVTAVGSGGTLAGLIMGSQLLELSTRIVGFNVCASERYFKKRVAGIIKETGERFGLPVQGEGNWEIIDGYVGRGYALTQPEELATLRLVAEKEGIILDPVYTGKAFHGLLKEIQKGRFGTGKKILFLHSGGIFGLFTRDYSSELGRT